MTRLQNMTSSHCLLLLLLACGHVIPLSLALSETVTKKSPSSWGGMTLPSTLPIFTSATHPHSLLQRHDVLEEEEKLLFPLTTTTTRQPTAKQSQSPPASSSSSRRQFKNIEDLLASFREEPVLIAFTAVNCGPCKLQKQELEKAQKRLLVLVDKNEQASSSSTTTTTTASSSSPATATTISSRTGRRRSSFPRVVAIDTNKWPNVGSRFQVGKLPCLVAILNGKVLFRLEGLTKAEDVVARLLINNCNNIDDDYVNVAAEAAAASLSSVSNVPQQNQSTKV